jgi:hypothetical protein
VLINLEAAKPNCLPWMRSSLTLGGCARLAAECRSERCRVYSSLRMHSCHGGRNKQHVFSLLPQWAALRPLLLSHPSLRGAGHNCRLASCGRHGSELRDMVQPVRQHSIIGLGGWSRAIRNTCRELIAEGSLHANSKMGCRRSGKSTARFGESAVSKATVARVGKHSRGPCYNLPRRQDLRSST